MKKSALALAILIGSSSFASAEGIKYIEQTNSIYFCNSKEEALGLAHAYVPNDDFDQKNYVESHTDCARLPPIAEAKFNLLNDRLEDNVLRIKLVSPAELNSTTVWIDTNQLLAHVNEYNKVIAGKPTLVRYESEKIGCPSLQSATDHFRLANIAKQSGALFLGESHESNKPGQREEFTCSLIPKGRLADAYVNDVKNGFIRVRLYDEAGSTLWLPAE